MKKLILSTLSIGLALGSIAQQNLGLKNIGQVDNTPLKGKKTVSLGKADRSDWYNSLIMKANGNFKTFVGFMMNDSLAKFVDDQGVPSQGRTIQAVGVIIDPKDDALDLSDDPTAKMSKFTNYSLDSIEFSYAYVRRVNNTVDGLGNPVPVVDTLFVYYFTGKQIIKTSKQTWASSLFGTFGWDFTKRRPANFASVDTVLLTADLSTGAPSATGWRLSSIGLKAPAGLTVNANGGSNTDNLAGFAILFKSGTTYDDTYTFEDRRDSTLTTGNKWTNYFLYRFGSNEGADLVSTQYTSSVIVPQKNSYAPNNGWNGWIAGQAFTNEQYLDAGMKLSSTNLSAKEVPNSFTLGYAYPNPASNDVTIAFDLKARKDVKISLVNLLGQEVISIANDNFSAGNNEVKFNVGNLSAGVYFYTMTVDGISQSQKIMIK
ncbi:MAG: T9SS type A sorting domain-containing protein [Candidatus Methylacidiphilales bacterium]